jgi:hypothetical protein
MYKNEEIIGKLLETPFFEKHDNMISLTFGFYGFCFACLRPVSCVLNVDSVSVVSILGCLSFFSNVSLKQ